MKKILLIHPEGNINYNPNLTGIVEILCEQGYEVEIASARRSDFPQRDPCAGATFHVFDVPAIDLARKHKFFIPAGLESNPGTLRTYINETFGEIHLVIGVDLGIIEASVVARALHVPFGLISYEIYFAEETGAEFKSPEVEACRGLSFVVCQDRVRSLHLARENGIPLKKIIDIPVAGRKVIRGKRSYLMHELLGLKGNKKIALYIGAVFLRWAGFDGLLENTHYWSDDWVLVLHHNFGRYDQNTFNQIKKKSAGNVYTSPFPMLPFEKMHTLLHSADLGIAFYLPLKQQGNFTDCKNLLNIGMASGKIPVYLQHGLPIMINEIGEMSSYVRQNALGAVVKDFHDIPSALDNLTQNKLAKYKTNCYRFFKNKLDLDIYAKPLLNIIGPLCEEKTVHGITVAEKSGHSGDNCLDQGLTIIAPDNYSNQSWSEEAKRLFGDNADIAILKAPLGEGFEDIHFKNEILFLGASHHLPGLFDTSEKIRFWNNVPARKYFYQYERNIGSYWAGNEEKERRVHSIEAETYAVQDECDAVEYEKVFGKKAVWLPDMISVERIRRGKKYPPLSQRPIDILFIGKIHEEWYRNRQDILRRVNSHVTAKNLRAVIIDTSHDRLTDSDIERYYSQAKVVINPIGAGNFFNIRFFEALAAGCVCLQQTENNLVPLKAFQKRYKDYNAVYFTSDDLEQKISSLLADVPSFERKVIATRSLLLSHDTGESRFADLGIKLTMTPGSRLSDEQHPVMGTARKGVHLYKNSLSPSPRFSVGMIVLNAELLLEACLESIYDFAHEILIVEGSCPQARWDARPDGTSRDRTLDIIRNFPDPAGKIRLVASRAWGHKDEMVNAFIPYVTGDCLFQVDSDEIWMEKDLRQLRRIVTDDPSVTCIEFRPKQFWHNFETILAEGHWEDPFMRVFKFEPGARWLSHEPPVLLDPGGHPYNSMKRINATTLFGTTFFHYSYLTEEQAKWKGEFFKRYYDLSTVPSSDTSTRVAMTRDWFEKVWLPWADDPDGIERKYGTSPGGGPAWRPVGKTSRYLGDHPPAIKRHKLWADPEYHVPASGAQTGKKKRTPGKKRALVSYITAPLRLPPDYHVQFSNPGIARSMVRVLNEMHYQVDVVEWTDQSFRSEESYDLFIGHGGVNWEYLSRNVVGNAVKIYFSTGIYWKEFNKAEAERFADLEKRRGIRLPYDRWISVSEEFANHDADAIVCLGNGNAARTYARFPLCIPMNNGVYADDRYSPAAKDFDAGRRRFLFFSGAGSVHKGLDRLIEAFSGLDAELYCAGQIERSFFEAYRQDLESHPNIHILGWVQLKSPQFYELMNSCNCVIFPSCAEGQPGSVLECMNQGLVPIISKESNIDVKDFGVLLKTSSIQEIMKTVKLVSGRSVTWHRTRSLKTRDEIVAQYSEAAFCRNLRAAVERVIRRVSSVRDVRGRIAADAEVDPGAYLPSHADVHRDRTIKNVLWVRTDAIGDAVLASSMLPHIREKYKNAKITVLCQEQVEELYKPCPFVDDIITFQKTRAYEDKNYRDGVVNRIQTLHADVALISVYSRAPLTDLFAAGSNAKERIGFYGDLSNMDAETRDRNNRYYTRILPSEGDCEPEIRRHKDFLKGIGIEASRLGPVIWLTPEDEQFADNFFQKNNLIPEQTIALFAGVQNDVRLYEHYGLALSQICKDGQFTVVSLGAAADRSLNQQNLDAIGVRTLNLSGETTLRQAAAIIKRCRLAAGAETSMAHIACAVGTPNVIVMGGGHFGRFMPYSPLTSLVCLPLECCCCGWRCEFGRAHCIRDILPEVFAEAVRRTLDRASAKPRVFVQGESLWRPRPGLPSWKWFSKFPDIAAVEIIPVGDVPDISCSGSAPDERMLPAAELQMLLEQPGLPESAVMSLKQADEEFRQGDLSSARDRLRQILQAMPSSTRVIIAFGAVLFRLGDVENARREFLKAMILDRPYALDHLPVAALKDLAAFYKANGYADTALLLYKKVSEKAG